MKSESGFSLAMASQLLRDSRNSVMCGPNDLIFWLHS